jgi:hypothetical protein
MDTDSLVDCDCLYFVLFMVSVGVHYRGDSLRGDSMTDGCLKLVFVKEILPKPMREVHIFYSPRSALFYKFKIS